MGVMPTKARAVILVCRKDGKCVEYVYDHEDRWKEKLTALVVNGSTEK